MHCKHCGKKLKYDPNNDTYAVYNGDIYCGTECMLFDVDYSGVDVSSFSKDAWDSNDYFDEKDHNNMSLQDAMSILIRHNKWRRDNHVPNKYEMVDPTELGVAIEAAINTLSACIDSNCESCEDIINTYRELQYIKYKYDID